MVVVQFDLNRDINGAARDVEAGFRGARRPADTLRNNPTYANTIRGFAHPDSFVDVEHLDDAQLYDSANTIIHSSCRRSPASARLRSAAAPCPRWRVELEPDKLSSYGIGLEDVRAAIAAANADSAKGHVDQGISATR